MRERSVDELANELIAIYSGLAPVSQSRQTNKGQRCFACGGVCGSRAITNGTQFWHPGCTTFTSLSEVNSSVEIASAKSSTAIQSELLHTPRGGTLNRGRIVIHLPIEHPLRQPSSSRPLRASLYGSNTKFPTVSRLLRNSSHHPKAKVRPQSALLESVPPIKGEQSTRL
jgi:hypothetical protein